MPFLWLEKKQNSFPRFAQMMYLNFVHYRWYLLHPQECCTFVAHFKIHENMDLSPRKALKVKVFIWISFCCVHWFVMVIVILSGYAHTFSSFNYSCAQKARFFPLSTITRLQVWALQNYAGVKMDTGFLKIAATEDLECLVQLSLNRRHIQVSFK